MTFEYKHSRISIYQDVSGFMEARIEPLGITLVTSSTEEDEVPQLLAACRGVIDSYFKERLLYAVKSA
jgi:hypothetical protein